MDGLAGQFGLSIAVEKAQGRKIYRMTRAAVAAESREGLLRRGILPGWLAVFTECKIHADSGE